MVAMIPPNLQETGLCTVPGTPEEGHDGGQPRHPCTTLPWLLLAQQEEFGHRSTRRARNPPRSYRQLGGALQCEGNFHHQAVIMFPFDPFPQKRKNN